MNTTQYTEEYKKVNIRKQIVLDIETIPNLDVVDLLPEPSIDARLKDPTKVAEAKANAKQNQLERMALSPLTGMVACVGCYTENRDPFTIILGAGHSEKSLLNAIYLLLQEYQIITYNGKNFDIPFIFKRGIILSCEWATIPNMKLYTDRYKSSDLHIDLMTEFCNYGEYEKLDNLSRFILGYGKPDFDVTQISTLLKTEEGRKQIADYCLSDCKITWELAKKMGFINV